MQLTDHTTVDFKGILLQARRKAGEKYVFLLFRTTEGLRICMNKDAKLVKSMKIGRTYRVKGLEYTRGLKTYINMQSVAPVLPGKVIFKRKLGLLASAVSLVMIIGFGSTGWLSRQDGQRNNETDTPNVKIQNQQDVDTPNQTDRLTDIIKPTPPGSTNTPSAAGSTRQSTPTQSAGNQTIEPTVTPTPAPTPEPTPETPTPTPEPTPTPTPSPTPEPTPEPPPAQNNFVEEPVVL